MKQIKFNKILVTQYNMIGDVVLSTGFVRALREQFPQSKIAFLVSPQTADLVRLPFIDEVVPYEKGMPLLPVIRKLWHYDVALLLDFKYRSAFIPFLARIPVRAGIAHKRKLFMTHAIERPAYSEHMYFTRYLAKVMETTIGLKLHSDVTRLTVAEATIADKKVVGKALSGMNPEGLKIAIAPFSSSTMKDWPVSCYHALCAKLSTGGGTILLLGGMKDCEKEFPLTSNVIDLRGKLPLTATAEVLRHVDAFIGSCSAPLHIATAVGTPALAFYGPTSIAKWAPVHKCITLAHTPPCSPCDRIGYGSTCHGNNFCMKSITVDEAWEALQRLLKMYPRK